MVNKAGFDVVAFSAESFCDALGAARHKQKPLAAKDKRQARYLLGYLDELKAKTLVIEKDYVDRDFLEDYAAYYVRCFPEYKRTCARIHCFTAEFAAEDFKKYVAGEESALQEGALQESYLGFIVVKPLPETIIGRTCLQTYDSNQRRRYPAARAHHANLFGIDLKIESTLPFQEQDSVVAACATSALWSVFHATAREFQHSFLSPVEITRAATKLFPAETRAIPNHGLNMQQMAHAIRSVELEPMLAEVSQHYLLQIVIYSYLRARIPLLLGAALYEQTAGVATQCLGKHAIAVVGYNLGAALTPIGKSALRLTSSRIDKIYVHDDQIGPFARMELNGSSLGFKEKNGSITQVNSLKGAWESSRGDPVHAVPDMLMVPLYHKIRIEWLWAFKFVSKLDEFFISLRNFDSSLEYDELEWDVYLSCVNDFKAEMRASKLLSAEERLNISLMRMPRFIWRAVAKKNDARILDLVFDATDIETGDVLVLALVYDASLRGLFTQQPGFDNDQVDTEMRKVIRKVQEHYNP